jgi:hypothetical protein
MAQEVVAQEVVTGRRAQRIGMFAGPPIRMSWGAIFGGTVAALGVGILLYSLGFALGLTAIDPNEPGTLRGSGIFTGVWSLVTAFIALFVGGMVASRGSGALTKAGGALHGLVMWGLTTLIGLAMAFLLVSRIVGGVASLGGEAVSGAASAVSGVDAGKIASTFGIDADDALAPVNKRLQAEGKPKISAEQLTAATRDIAQDSLRRGRVDREGLVASIAQHTALSRADAEQVAAGVEQQIKSAGGKVGRTLEDVKTGALAAAEDTGKAFWGVFGALLLGMLSAVLGATVGMTKRQRLWAERYGDEFGAPVMPAAPRTSP